MKALLVGDLHYKGNNITETYKLTSNIVSKIKELDPDLVILLGDILDRFGSADIVLLTEAVKFIKEIAFLKPVFVIIGNHDRRNNSDFLTDYSPFYALHDFPNIKIIDKVEYFEFENSKLLFVPYVQSGRFLEAIQTRINIENINDIDIIFAHQEIRGVKFKISDNETSSSDDIWPETYPLLISGHIHDYQEMNDNIIYIGAPRQISFKESNDKALALLTLTEDSYTLDRIYLPVRQKIEKTISFDELANYKPPKDCDLKLTINHTPGEKKLLLKSNKCKELKKNGININFNEIKDKNSVNITPTNEAIIFSAALYNRIKNNPRLLSIHQELSSN